MSEISQFLTWLAVQRRISASTQNQALSALLFLYKEVLAIEIAAIPPVVRARTPERLPVVLSRDEIGAILKQLTGTERLIVMVLYGSGVRLEECLDLRVKDVDFDRQQIVVRQRKGQKDRVTMLPAAVREVLTRHLGDVRRQHERDLARGFGRVVLPFALDRKYPNAATASRVVTGTAIVLPAWKPMRQNGFVVAALLVQFWMRASGCAYPRRSAIRRRFLRIAFARIQARKRAGLLLESPAIPGATTVSRRRGITRGLAVY